MKKIFVGIVQRKKRTKMLSGLGVTFLKFWFVGYAEKLLPV